jgi:NitT/TauT family transport system substrate-binding protein
MFKNSKTIWQAIAVLSVLGNLFWSWNYLYPKWKSASQLSTLTIGYAPLLAQLGAHQIDFANQENKKFRFPSRRFETSDQVMDAFAKEKIDAAIVNMIDAFRLRASGSDFRGVLLSHRNGSALVVREKFRGQTIGELRGMRIGVPSFSSVEYLVLRELLRSNRVSSSDVQLIAIPSKDVSKALLQNKIDAAFLEAPFVSETLLHNKVRIFGKSQDLWPGFFSHLYIIRNSIIEKNPVLAEEFVMQASGVSSWMELNRDQLVQAGSQIVLIAPNILELSLLGNAEDISFRNLIPLSHEVRDLQDLALRFGVLERPVELSDILDLGLAP